MNSSLHWKIGTCLFLIVSLCIGIGAAGAEERPLMVVRTGTEQVLSVLKNSRSNQVGTTSESTGSVVNIVSNYMDFQEMSSRVLGQYWKKLTPEKRQEFVRLFSNLFYNTYVHRMDLSSYSDAQIMFDQEKIDGNYAVVKTRISSAKNPRIMIDYRLRSDERGWKVYDVVVEGISLVDNYRSQFNTLLNNESFDNLLSRLRQRIAA